MSHPVTTNSDTAALSTLSVPGITVNDVAMINATVAVNVTPANIAVAVNVVTVAHACTTNGYWRNQTTKGRKR